jgi:hypothetical protein
VAALIRARRLERMTDEDFRAECRADARLQIAEAEAGGYPWNILGDEFKAGLLADMRSALASGSYDREGALADALDSLRRHGGGGQD